MQYRGTTGLVEDLNRKPRDAVRDSLLVRVIADEFHDFRSPHALPKFALVEELDRYGYEDLARRARRGEYDDSPDAEDRAAMEQAMAADPALAATWERLKKTDDLPTAMRIVTEAIREKAKP